MPTLDLTLSAQERQKIRQGALLLKQHLDQRKELWAMLPKKKQIAWLQSDKDEVMSFAFDIMKYFHKNFNMPEKEIKYG